MASCRPAALSFFRSIQNPNRDTSAFPTRTGRTNARLSTQGDGDFATLRPRQAPAHLSLPAEASDGGAGRPGRIAKLGGKQGGSCDEGRGASGVDFSVGRSSGRGERRYEWQPRPSQEQILLKVCKHRPRRERSNLQTPVISGKGGCDRWIRHGTF